MPSYKSAENWLLDDFTYTTPIMAILTDKFGTEFIEWDPVTVNIEIKESFGIDATDSLLDKIQAGSTVINTNLFHLSLEAFNVSCNTLNLGVAASELMLPADLEDIMWGITEAKILEGDMFEETAFSHNIARYVGFLLAEAGHNRPPSILKFAEYDEEEERRLSDAFPSEDPLLFNTFWDKQQEDKEDLEKINKIKFHNLVRQLSELPINIDKEYIQKGLESIEREFRPPVPQPS